nr:hypothetical protein [Chloroflexota bacterium]
MIVPLLLLAAAVAVAAGALLLRSVGPGYRLARLLHAAPSVSLADAVERTATMRGYVKVRGRITSDEEFPDENDRPLVFRRRRLQIAEGRGWRTLDEERLAVPFGLEDRSDFLAIDAEALGEGLVVIPREATGLASEVVEALPEKVPRDARVRLRIDQLSAVEHATAVGVPAIDRDGQPVLTSGLGRPLIVAAVEGPEAMRLLAAGHRRRLLVASALLLG